MRKMHSKGANIGVGDPQAYKGKPQNASSTTTTAIFSCKFGLTCLASR